MSRAQSISIYADPYSKLEQNPTLKAEMKQLRESGDTASMTAGFFGYPISQAAEAQDTMKRVKEAIGY